MGSVNKVGLGSILVGLVLLALVWFLGFSTQSLSTAIVSLIQTAFVGGLILFALFLLLVGVLIIVV